jgi:uncharacterized cupin superfamily protein
MKRANVFNADFHYDDGDPAGYRAGMTNVGKAVGGEAINIKLFEVPPGESLCPYHYEYEEEWLIVLQGEVSVRTPDGTESLTAGDVVRFPPGPAGAHKVACRNEAPARFLMFSSSREPAVAVYPDSDKIGVWPGNEDDKLMVKRQDGAVDYYEGER